MIPSFKDNFSQQAQLYSQYRPFYPEELFQWLRTLTSTHELAWDCGCGNGQCAIQLIGYYERVFESDPSREQISN